MACCGQSQVSSCPAPSVSSPAAPSCGCGPAPTPQAAIIKALPINVVCNTNVTVCGCVISSIPSFPEGVSELIQLNAGRNVFYF